MAQKLIQRHITPQFLLLMTLVFLGWHMWTDHTRKKERTKILNTLTSILPQELTSFRVHPDKTFTDDYSDAIPFREDERMVLTLLHAIADAWPYQPEHDRALAQWGMQLQTTRATLNIGCYIPDLNPGVVVLVVYSGANFGYFQSLALLRWYQKYGHYWGNGHHRGSGHYQKEQYKRAMPFLSSLTPEKITSFKVGSRALEIDESKRGTEFSKNDAIVVEFFHALEDQRFINRIPYESQVVMQWKTQILKKAGTITIEFSVYEDSPTVVIGLVDSYAGYTYFQSRKLYQWYQKYSHRWLESEESQPTLTRRSPIRRAVSEWDGGGELQGYV